MTAFGSHIFSTHRRKKNGRHVLSYDVYAEAVAKSSDNKSRDNDGRDAGSGASTCLCAFDGSFGDSMPRRSATFSRDNKSLSKSSRDLYIYMMYIRTLHFDCVQKRCNQPHIVLLCII